MAEHDLTGPPLVERYRKHFEATWNGDSGIDDVRFVVLDTETTGFDPVADRIVTIGAVCVEKREIVLSDSFSCLLKIDSNTTAVTVHGITRDMSRKGVEERPALELFLDYLKDGVIVGHHIGHDLAALDATCDRHWGIPLSNRWIDTEALALTLEKDGVFPARTSMRRLTLDALCSTFQVIPHDRHTAAGDAFITAQVFIRLLHLALRSGKRTLGQITESPETSL